ncbi:MAG: 3-dehydroquinate synthase [Lachnospiraceae bacterium]
MELSVNLKEHTSRIIIKKGVLAHLNEYLNLDCKVMIISDHGVPPAYQKEVQNQCKNGFLFLCDQGEQTKSLSVYEAICIQLSQLHFSRDDLVIALGGGVIGDLSGFVAATFKRGMRFASIPTTTLSQIDSSIGGKVAVNLGETKNVLGTFFHPEVVLIDITTLKTLTKRHYYNGLVEAVKAGLIADPVLFSLFEEHQLDYREVLEEMIVRSLLVKKNVVEQDEKEEHLRKMLNFGHTIGHAIESIYHLHDYYHGECVAMGMMKILEKGEIKNRLAAVLTKMEIPLSVPCDSTQVLDYMKKDKKVEGNHITIIQVEAIGHAQFIDLPIEDLEKYC